MGGQLSSAKPLPEPVITQFIVTISWPQWVKWYSVFLVVYMHHQTLGTTMGKHTDGSDTKYDTIICVIPDSEQLDCYTALLSGYMIVSLHSPKSMAIELCKETVKQAWRQPCIWHWRLPFALVIFVICFRTAIRKQAGRNNCLCVTQPRHKSHRNKTKTYGIFGWCIIIILYYCRAVSNIYEYSKTWNIVKLYGDYELSSW